MKTYCSMVITILLSAVCILPGYADMTGTQSETPSSMKQPPMAGAAETNRNGVPKLTVEFEVAHAEIPASYQPNLNAFGKYLQDHPQSMARIAGYADHSGSGPANTTLAQKRADAVKNYIVANSSVTATRITAEGYGEVSGKTRNNTEAGKQANRSAIGTIINPKP